MRTRFLFAFSLLLCTLVFAASVGAQTINGNITGQVTDQSGAAVSGATVTATNVETGATRNVTTNDEGLYRFTALTIGVYTVRAEGAGFAPQTVENIGVSVATDTEANIQLGVAGVSEVVNVTEGGVTLDTQQSQVASVVEQRRILELPGRNSLTGLALLNPGVLPNQNNRPGSGFAVNGNRTRSNNFTIDGASNNDQSLATPRQNLPPEAIAEFQIITNTFSAEFGRNAGSYINQITQSGTNEFHGTGFYVWGGNGLDALTTAEQRTFNANRAAGRSEYDSLRAARSVTVSNTYGFTLGGPIVRNNTFFFTSFDANDFRTTVSSPSPPRVALSPTAIANLNANRANFAPGTLDFLLANFPVANDPTSRGSVTVTNPGGTSFAVPFQIFNRGATAGIPFGTDFERFLIKGNTRINSNDQLSIRYLIDRSRNPGTPANLPGQEVGTNAFNQSFTINDTYTITPSLINEFRFTYSRRSIQFPENFGFSFSINTGTNAFTLGNANFPQSRLDNVFEFTDNVSYTTGNHSFKFGYNLLRYDLDSFFAPNLRGTVSYPSLSDFLQDRNASFSQFAGTGQTKAITYEHSFFAQDDWRVRPDLTLNLGLRYEYVTAPFGFFSDASPDINNFGPRVGFAYNPSNFLDGRFVLRAGFGISYDQVFQNILLNNSRNFPRGVNVAFTNITGQRPFLNLPAPPDPEDFTGNPLTLPVRLFSPDERIRQPMSYQGTVGVQFQLGNDYVFKADYITTHGRNLVREVESNFGFTAASGLGNGQRIDPTRGSILVSQGQADSVYHAGQFTLAKRFSNIQIFNRNFGGISFNANYTYSAFISESDDILGGQANRTLPADPRNPQLDRARSAFDQPHRFVMSGVFVSPEVFGGGALNRIFGGFELAPIITLASGTPYSVLNANNALGILAGQIATVTDSQRVSVNPSGQFPLVSTPTAPNPNAYFIVNAANSGILGNLGANTQRTGGTINTDLSVVKNIRTFGESQRLQLRAEIFNLFNRRNFTVIPSNTIGNSVNTDLFLNLGQTNVPGRGFTFGARYFF